MTSPTIAELNIVKLALEVGAEVPETLAVALAPPLAAADPDT